MTLPTQILTRLLKTSANIGVAAPGTKIVGDNPTITEEDMINHQLGTKGTTSGNDGGSVGVVAPQPVEPKVPEAPSAAENFLTNLPAKPVAPVVDVPNSPLDPNQSMATKAHNFMKRPLHNSGNVLSTPYAMAGAAGLGLGGYALYKLLSKKKGKTAAVTPPSAQTLGQNVDRAWDATKDMAGQAHDWASKPLDGKSNWTTPYAMGGMGLGAYGLWKLLSKNND